MSLMWRLSNIDYLAWLVALLGFSFQFSRGIMNVSFYLATLTCLLIIISNSYRHKALPWKQVFSSPLWRLVTVWIVLLALSITYSEPSDKALMSDYAWKYSKYLLAGIITVVTLFNFDRYRDLPKYFFAGLIIGGVISAGLSVLNGTTGWLNLLAKENIIPWKYLKTGFWISNESFAYSLFMAVVFLYGFVQWFQSKRWYFLILCSVGVFGVFVVSHQRTGFFSFFLLSFWLLWQFIPAWWLRVFSIIGMVLFLTVTFKTNNQVKGRFRAAKNEVKKCMQLEKMENIKLVTKACRSNNGLRVLFYHDSLRQIEQSPLYGHGLANLRVRTLQRNKKNKITQFSLTNNPHNEYLLQGIHLGIPGIAMLIAIFLFSYRHAMQIKGPRKHLYAGIILMYASSCLFNSFLLDTTQGLFFTMIVSFIIAERAHEKKADMEST